MILEGISVVLNFLKYVVAHQVCPEYLDDLERAQEVCERAKSELPQLAHLLRGFPGEFNTAARHLYCQVGPGEGDDERSAVVLDSNTYTEFDKNTLLLDFYTTLLIWSAKETAANSPPRKPISVMNMAEQVFEFIEMPEGMYPENPRRKGAVMPTLDQQRKYERVKQHKDEGKRGFVKPCGVVRLNPTSVVDGWDHPSEPVVPHWLGDFVDLFLELELIEHLEVGMKLRLVVCELDSGIKFIHRVRNIYATFHIFLPQTLMLKYKRPALNERPGPSEDLPHAEDDNDGHSD
jgi:hypothetical protein